MSSSLEAERRLDRKIILNQLTHGPLSLDEIADLIDNNTGYTHELVADMARARTGIQIVRVDGKWTLGSAQAVYKPRITPMVQMAIETVRDGGEICVSDPRFSESRKHVMGNLCQAAIRGWFIKTRPEWYGKGPKIDVVRAACVDKLSHEGMVLRFLKQGMRTPQEMAKHIKATGALSNRAVLVFQTLIRIRCCTGFVKQDGEQWLLTSKR